MIFIKIIEIDCPICYATDVFHKLHRFLPEDNVRHMMVFAECNECGHIWCEEIKLTEDRGRE